MIACIVIAGSLAMRVGVGRSGETFGNSSCRPCACPARRFGVSCPGCGLRRSFIYLAHGDWDASWQSHRLGWLLAAMVALQIPYRIHGLRFIRAGEKRCFRLE